jgi:cellulose synthase/poly-beta-1,6-N-acetylglucosamine synthase-like glycosyltransferase
VLIPAWNEEVGVAATIRSVLATGYPHLEVVVVNDGSTDRTHEVVQELLAGLRPEGRLGGPGGAAVHYRRVPNGGKARALNTALAVARGEIVVTIDADSVMEPDFLDRIVLPFRQPAVAAAAGSVVVGNRGRAIGMVQALEYLYGFYFKRADALLGAVYIVGGAAAAYRRRVVAELGGFDETVITEDIELSTRLQHRGYAVGYAADAVVHTEGPSDLWGLCRQRLRWKYGRLLTFLKYRDLFFSRRPDHNGWLTFVVLPVALFAELLLLLEPVLLSTFYGHTFYAKDFAPLAVAVAALAGVVALQVATSPRVPGRGRLLALAPVA